MNSTSSTTCTNRPPQHCRALAPLLVLFIVLLLAACTSDTDPEAATITEPVYGVDEDGVHYVGSDRCLSCHEEPGKVEDTEPAATYLASRHAIPGSVGADADPACLACHDPIGDGINLGPWFTDHQQPPAGMTAVGCENCHGTGAHHLTMIPAHPNPVPDYHACGQCHKALPDDHDDFFGHGDFTGFYADNIFETFLGSPHAQWARGNAPCFRCHSDEGFRAYAEETEGMDGDELIAYLAGEPTIVDPSFIQCRTCHDGHTGELRLSPTIEEENGDEVIKFSRLFNLCTSCHQAFLKTDFDAGTGTYEYFLDTEKQPFHANWPDAEDMIITDTHFATEDGTITGYPIDPASEMACLGCHDPHAASKPW